MIIFLPNSAVSGTETANTPLITLPVVTPVGKSQQSKVDGPGKATTSGQKVLTIESKEHFEKILKEAGDKYVLVEFFAMWCSPCKQIGLKLEEWAEQYRDKVVIVKIDVDTLEELAIEHDVTNMPAFMIMRNNAKVEQFAGSKVEYLESVLEKYLGKTKE